MALTSPFNNVAAIGTPQAAQLTSAPLNETDPEPIIINAPPSQQNQVSSQIDNFRKSFAARVQTRNYSGEWNNCFSIKSGKAKIEYSISKVVFLRASASDIFKVDYHRKPIIILDLGHGHETPGTVFGYDTGAIRHGIKEALMVDSIASKLQEKLERETGAIVIPTRKPIKDGVSLRRDEAKFDNQESALQMRAEMTSYLTSKFPDSPVLFISLHGNAEKGTKSAGGIVFYYAPEGRSSTDSLESHELARNISANYQLRAGTRTITRAEDFAVLRCQYKETPAVLIELGYLSNAGDRAALLSNVDSITTGIANGVKDYLNEAKPRLPQMQVASNAP